MIQKKGKNRRQLSQWLELKWAKYQNRVFPSEFSTLTEKEVAYIMVLWSYIVSHMSSLLERLFHSDNLKIWFIFPQTIEFEEFKIMCIIICTSHNNPVRWGLLLTFHETNGGTDMAGCNDMYMSLSETICDWLLVLCSKPLCYSFQLFK